jgi:signal peptidase II
VQKAFDAGNVTDTRVRNTLFAISTAADVLTADLITKYLLFDKPELMVATPFSGFFRLTNHQNTGITFDLPLPLPVVIALTAFIVAFIIRTLIKKRDSLTIVEAIAYGLILGGALGNLTDRIWLGFVRDWMLFFGRSAMNLADFSILGGLILLIFTPRKDSSTEPPRQDL